MSDFAPSAVKILLASAVLALASGSPSHAQELQYVGSLGFFTGSYIYTERTESVSFLNGLNFKSGRFSLSAAVPLVAQTSGGVAFLGGGMMPTGEPNHGGTGNNHSHGGMGGMGGFYEIQPEVGPSVTSSSGFETTLGDPLIRGSFVISQTTGTLRSLSVVGAAKVPLAPVSSGIGTGAWDYGVGASATTTLGKTVVMASATLWSPGDLPELVLNEYADFSLGAGRLINSRWSLLSTLNVATSIIDSIQPPASLALSVGYRASGSRALNGGISFGLSEASPDFAIFLGWSLGLMGMGEG